MSKQSFLLNFRTARNLFFHPRVETIPTGGDPNQLEKMIAKAAIWLTPKSVADFDPDDFSELGPAVLGELEKAVRDFLQIARQVPPANAASSQQLQEATAAFLRLLGILEPYLAGRDEAKALEEVIDRLPFPPWAVNWDYEFGSDESGSPVVWINVFVDESAAPRNEFARFASQLSVSIRHALSALGINRWPYVRIRSAIEHKSA
jgi:hypothetical protein